MLTCKAQKTGPHELTTIFTTENIWETVALAHFARHNPHLNRYSTITYRWKNRHLEMIWHSENVKDPVLVLIQWKLWTKRHLLKHMRHQIEAGADYWWHIYHPQWIKDV